MGKSKLAENAKLLLVLVIVVGGVGGTAVGIQTLATQRLQNSVSDLQNQYNILNQQYTQVSSKFENLSNYYTALIEGYTILESNCTLWKNKWKSLNDTYTQLLVDYNTLNDSYTLLLTEYTSLQNLYSALQKAYSDLQSMYGALQSNYETLLVQYNDLLEAYNLYITTLLQLPLQYRLLLIYEYLRRMYEPGYPYDWQAYTNFMAKMVLHDTAQYNYFALPNILQQLLPDTSWIKDGDTWQTPSQYGPWHNGLVYMWNSNDGMDILLTGKAYIDPINPVLTLTTKYDIEQYWDYGFVQVSTDNGETWNSLSNSYTTYYHVPDAHCRIVSNLPGLTGTSTNFPDNWITMYFDLSGYNRQTILIGFRYMTDWGATGSGWFINSATVSGVNLELTAEQCYQKSDFSAFETIAELAYNMQREQAPPSYIWAASGLSILTIHSWVVNHISYEYDESFANYSPLWDYPKFPMETLLRTYGDCEDQAILDSAFLESNTNPSGLRYETATATIHDPSHPYYGSFYHGFLFLKLGSTTAEAQSTLLSWGVVSGWLWKFPGYSDQYVWCAFDPTWDVSAGQTPQWLQYYYNYQGNFNQFTANMNYQIVDTSYIGTGAGVSSSVYAILV